MSKRIEIPKPTTGYGFVGAWMEGNIGWHMPDHVTSGSHVSGPNDRIGNYGHKNVRTFLCKITIEPITDGNGRPITRIAAKEKP